MHNIQGWRNFTKTAKPRKIHCKLKHLYLSATEMFVIIRKLSISTQRSTRVPKSLEWDMLLWQEHISRMIYTGVMSKLAFAVNEHSSFWHFSAWVRCKFIDEDVEFTDVPQRICSIMEGLYDSRITVEHETEDNAFAGLCKAAEWKCHGDAFSAQGEGIDFEGHKTGQTTQNCYFIGFTPNKFPLRFWTIGLPTPRSVRFILSPWMR